MSWFASISPSGRRVASTLIASGRFRVLVDGQDIGDGREAQWQDEDTIVCLGPERGVWEARAASDGWTWRCVHPDVPANRLSVSAAGWTVAVIPPGDPSAAYVHVHSGERFFGYGAAAIAPDGRVALGSQVDGAIDLWTPHWPLVTLTPRPSRDLRWTDGGLCWTEETSHGPQPFAWTETAAVRTTAVQPRELAVGLVRLGDDTWVLTLTDDALLLRPIGEQDGYRLPPLEYADARWRADTHTLRVVGTRRGTLVDLAVDLRAPRERLSDPPVPLPPPVIDPPVTPMQLPEPVKATIRAFFSRFGFARGEDAARELTHRLCEQVAYSHPGQGYGHKRADPGRPHSADALAQQVGPRLYAWDLIGDAGGANTLNVEAEAEDITGQTFEAVDPVDHLGGTAPPVPPPIPPPGPSGLTEARVRELIALALAPLRADLARAVRIGDDIALRTWSGKYLCAEGGGGGEVNATRDAAGIWEQFRLERL